MKLEIIDYGNNGEGIAKLDGKVYFVPGTLVGEIVDAEVTKTKSNFCFCRVNSIEKTSTDRVQPICKYFGKCGGCNLMHINEKAQSEIKTRVTQNTINKISKLDIRLDNLVTAKTLNYRNKMVFAFNENCDLCMHDIDNKLMPINYCYLEEEGIEKVTNIVQKFVKNEHLMGYSNFTKKGLLRYLVIRKLNEKFLITLVATKANIPNINSLVKMLKNEGLTFGLFVNLNTQNNSLILTHEFTKIFGIDYIDSEYVTLSGKSIKYTISPESFLQVNNEIKELIYRRVEQELKDSKTIIDAYSGAGLMTAIASSIADQAVGIEIVKSASLDADRLKMQNNIKNMQNINADCAVGLNKVPKNLINKGLSIILDPPRKGADQTVLNKVLDMKADKIVYISCNPATLARDLITLNNAYDVVSITPYDMFSNTAEVECFTILKRKGKVDEI